MINRCHNKHGFAHGFTLVELLVAMAIVGLLTAIALVGMAGVTENARGDRTRAQIARIHSLIAPRWAELHERRMKMSVGNFKYSGGGRDLVRVRLEARRELLRMAMPDRKSDLVDQNTVFPTNQPPGDWRSLRRKAVRLISNQKGIATPRPEAISQFLQANWSVRNQGAECLYLILSTSVDGERSALEFFREDEVGDDDGDGIPEIHDAWGQPIHFLRWAPGFVAAGSYQTTEKPDAADPLGIDAQYGTFQLFPLIVSAGSDKKLDIRLDYGPGLTDALRYQDPYSLPRRPFPARNYPYWNVDPTIPINAPSQRLIGGFADDELSQDGRNYQGGPTSPTAVDDSVDNIHNHLISTGR